MARRTPRLRGQAVRARGRSGVPGPALLPAIILGGCAALALALFVGVLGVFASYTTGLPDPAKLADFTLSEGSTIVSADGVELASVAAEQRRVVAYDQIPQLLVDAQVAAEDQTFWTNPCIDFRGILRAAIQNLRADRTVSGASTICQQLVRSRLLDPQLMADPSRILERKLKEAIVALRVGKRYAGQAGKEELLAMYMNQIYYGDQAYGIWAAANAYFGKDITSTAPDDQITIGEAAMLAGLVRAPSALDPTTEAVSQTDANGDTILVVPDTAGAKRVQGFVLANMVESGYITQAQANAAAAETIVLAPKRSTQYKAPHFVYAVRSAAAQLLGSEEMLASGGLTITTTLDYNGYQVSAEKWAAVAYDMDRMTDDELTATYGASALKWIKTLQDKNINNDAIVTVNYRTGAVLAYVGSANYYGEATDAFQPAFDVVGQAYRQSGSAFKPITYATGFERGVITPATMLMDVEGDMANGYTVPDADHGQRGPVLIRDALKYSLNIPAVKAQQIIGTQNVVAMAQAMGLGFNPAQDPNVPSLTLGTIGVHLLDLAGAYSVIADGGMKAPPYLIERITDRNGNVIYDHATDGPQAQRVLSEQSTYLVTNILADNTDPAKNPIWGPRFQLKTADGRRPATLKTGTTNNFIDLDAFGYLAANPDPSVSEGAIVTGVWVGNSDNTPPSSNIFAVDGPTWIWHDYMAEVADKNALPVRDFARPNGIVDVTVDAISGMLPGPYTTSTVNEVFDASTQPTRTDTLHRQLRIEAATGKIWQPGCGDYVLASPSPGASPASSPAPSAEPPPAVPDERVYLDLSQVEADHPTWQKADLAWIKRWQGDEKSLHRSPAGPLGAPLAPLETCTPGEIPTSTPSPSPSPTPSPTPTPGPSVTPEPSLTPGPSASPSPTLSPSPSSTA